jgi:hypothetical protein
MVLDLQTVDKIKTDVNIQIFVSLFIPEKETIENFVEELSESMVVNLQERLMA